MEIASCKEQSFLRFLGIYYTRSKPDDDDEEDAPLDSGKWISEMESSEENERSAKKEELMAQ